MADHIKLDVAQRARLDFTLEVGDFQQTITVQGGALLVNTEDGSVGTVVDRQFVENIPLNGRSFQSLITLTPGVVTVPAGATANTAGQFSVNGQRSDANAFVVDGVSANFAASTQGIPGGQTSGSLPGLTTFGTTQSLVSVDAMQEFIVQTSTYSAEYGRQPGGQISIVTRSGTNQFHGSAFDYLRNDKFDANDWFANANKQPRPPERQNDFGGTFGGPLLIPRLYNGHNHTFFFFSYEGLRLFLPKFAITNVPSLALRQAAPAALRPVLNAFPVPNGKDLGNGLAEMAAAYSDPSTLNAASIRIDHSVNSRLSLFGRFNWAPSQTDTRTNLASLSTRTISTIANWTTTLGATATLTPHLANDLRVNLSNSAGSGENVIDNFGGAVPIDIAALIPAQFASNTSRAQGSLFLSFVGRTANPAGINLIAPKYVDNQSQLNVVDGVSYSSGSHSFKLGLDFRRLAPAYSTNHYVLSATFLAPEQVMNAVAPSGFVSTRLAPEPSYVNFSAYGQDRWTVSRRLTLDLGLRWDVNPAPGERNGNEPLAVTQISNFATMQLAPHGTALWKTTFNDLAPRFGAAYLLRQDSAWQTVLRGGVGVFYDTGNNQGSAGFNSFPFTLQLSLTNISYPLSPIQVAPPALPDLSNLTPPYGTISTFDPNLRLPYALQWNIVVEQSLGKNQALSVSYVGAAGRRLLQQRQLTLSSSTVHINPSFTAVKLTTNNATSDYDALQAQFRRRLSRGLQVLASYTWSYALDDDTVDNGTLLPVRGNSAYDMRHNVAGALTYDIPAPSQMRLVNAVLGGWAVDSSIHVQSAFPIDITGNQVVNPADGSLVAPRVNVISGVPVYVYGPQYPGGEAINNAVPTVAQIAAAGCAPLSATTPAKGPFCSPPTGTFGNLGRNAIRGLGEWQVDFAVRREFRLMEKLKLQFRAEAFNIFNHPNFGGIQTSLTAANFGQATNMLNRQLGGLNALYQIGGPRSFQFALKVLF